MSKLNSAAAEVVSLGAKEAKRAGRLPAAVLTLAVLVSIGAGTARAQCPGGGTNAISWDGGDGNWGDTNWSIAGCVPNNAPPAFFDVSINGSGDTVTFNVGPAIIDSLELGATETLQDDAVTLRQLTIDSSNAAGTFTNNGTVNWGNNSNVYGVSTLTLDISIGNGTINNTGTINLTSSAYGFGVLLINDSGFGHTATLDGLGTINLSGALISGAYRTETLDNVDNTISGSGTIGNLTLVNAGKITATGFLGLSPGAGQTVTNNYIMTAASGGALVWDATSSPSSFNNQGTVTVNDGGTMELWASPGQTAYFNNDRTITVGSINGANLELEGGNSTFDLGGLATTGSLTLNGMSAISGIAGSELLINDTGHTIFASCSSPSCYTSYINNLDFTNNGTVSLTTSGSLDILPTGLSVSPGVTNNGAMQVAGTGTLGWDASVYSGASLSAPAFNNQGTVTVNDGGTLILTAPAGQTAYFNNDGGITVGNSSGADLVLNGNGSAFDLGSVAGTGSLTLNNGFVSGTYGTEILINDTGHTIQGSGVIENLTFVNNGTLQANSGDLLHVMAPVSFTNFNGGTLAGGSYVMNNGTIQIDPLGQTGGEITTLGDGATPTSVILNGASAAMTDGSGINAFALATINANASLTIANGYNMTTPGNLTNAGTLKVGTLTGAPSTLTINSGGTGTLTNNTGGVIYGTGNIVGNVNNVGGTVSAADPGTPDTLTITGNYTQGAGGTLIIDITGANAGQYSVLDVTGMASLGGTLDIDFLNGFTPAPGEMFPFLTYGSLNPSDDNFSSVDFGNCPNCAMSVFGPNGAAFEPAGPGGSVPEPSALILLGTALLGIAAYGMVNRRCA